MKVLLLIPPEIPRHPIPYLGILYIASALRKSNILVKILDCRLSDLENDVEKFVVDKSINILPNYEKLARAILNCEFDVVGITATTPTIIYAHNLAKIIKKKFPEKKIIIGGVHASALPVKTLEQFPYFDIVVKGEGEDTIVKLVQELQKFNFDLSKVDNIVFRQNGKILETKFSSFPNVNELPFPAKDIAPMDKYQRYLDKSLYLGKNINAYGMMITSRGCPALCTYCASYIVHERKFRARRPEEVFSEIEFLYDKYAVKRLVFWDDNFTWINKRAIDICNLIIKNNLNLIFSCFARVNTINFELLQKMKEAGCVSITYGLETGSERVLKDLKKGSTLEEAINAVKLTRKAGISAASGFMLGNPTDDIKSIKETIYFAKKLIYYGLDSAGFFITVPYPGTEMYSKEYEKIKNFNWDSYSHTGMNVSSSMLSPNNITTKELLFWQKKAYKIFNRNLILRELMKKNFSPLKKAIIIKFKKFWNLAKNLFKINA